MQAFGLAVLTGAEPLGQAAPARPPVRDPFLGSAEQRFVGFPGQPGEPVGAGGLHLGHGGGQQRREPGQLGVELPHVGEQRVLVREEHFGPGVVGARQIAQHQVEPGGTLCHVGQHAVQPGQLPVHLRGVRGPHRPGERPQVGEDVGEHEAG